MTKQNDAHAMVNYWLMVYRLANAPTPAMLKAAPNTSTPHVSAAESTAFWKARA